LEPEVGPIIVKELEDHGVRYKGEVQPRFFEGDGKRARRLVTDQGSFPADLFFVGVGVLPNAEIAREAGIIIGSSGGIQVNSFMQTSDPLIWAAGDCCEKLHLVTGRPQLAPLGDVANKEGRVAGENAVGGHVEFHGIVGAASVKVFDLQIGMVGINESQARKMGFPVIAQTVEGTSRAAIFPGSRPNLLKIVADQSSGRLLAVAVHQAMTLEAISRLDLAYAPPFSPVWDPLLTAANLLKKQVKGVRQ
jgi:NADPH-dependent 2,4-dienoyl-CoA reductase/sulfur reductase-like enzyme